MSTINSAQYIRVTAQVASGDVTFVATNIGLNDFARQESVALYHGSISGNVIDNNINNVVGDTAEAIDATLAASNPAFLLSDLYDH